MARPMKPLVRGGGYYPSNGWTPLVYAGGYTTANGGGEPEPPPIEKTITGNPIHITDALAKPAQALSIALEPIQDLHGYDNPWPAGGGKNLLPSGGAFDVTTNGVRFTSDGKGNYTIKGTATANAFYNFHIEEVTLPSTVFGHLLNNTSNNMVSLAFFYGNTQLDYKSMAQQMRIVDLSSTLGGETINGLRFFVLSGAEIDISCSPMLCVDNTATPYSPYSNICPISGWTGANIHVSPTTDAADGTTYSITFPTEAGTVYGGTLDVTTGKLTVDRAIVDLGTLAWGYQSSPPQFYSNGIAETSINWLNWNDTPPLVCSRYKPISNALLASSDFCIGYAYNSKQLRVNDSGFTDAATFKTAMSGVQLVYELANPIEITLTPTQIEMLLGENNLWSDAGDSTMTYYAEGNASTSEALGILLGGTYNNPGGADDASDDEALGILLGGS